jgi:hypothetical protein
MCFGRFGGKIDMSLFARLIPTTSSLNIGADGKLRFAQFANNFPLIL